MAFTTSFPARSVVRSSLRWSSVAITAFLPCFVHDPSFAFWNLCFLGAFALAYRGVAGYFWFKQDVFENTGETMETYIACRKAEIVGIVVFVSMVVGSFVLPIPNRLATTIGFTCAAATIGWCPLRYAFGQLQGKYTVTAAWSAWTIWWSFIEWNVPNFYAALHAHGLEVFWVHDPTLGLGHYLILSNYGDELIHVSALLVLLVLGSVIVAYRNDLRIESGRWFREEADPYLRQQVIVDTIGVVVALAIGLECFWSPIPNRGLSALIFQIAGTLLAWPACRWLEGEPATKIWTTITAFVTVGAINLFLPPLHNLLIKFGGY